MKRISVILESLGYFWGGELLAFVAAQYVTPILPLYGITPPIGWWLTSGVILVALFVGAILGARFRLRAKSVREVLLALNLRPMSKTDTIWMLGGLFGVVMLTAIVVTIFDKMFQLNLLSDDLYAPFLRVDKLKSNEYWLFLLWLPYFLANIFGQELMWRGYLLPLQAKALGRYAWVLNGLLWAMFHVGMGWRIATVLLPIEFIVPYIVQKRQNTWIGIIIHGLYIAVIGLA